MIKKRTKRKDKYCKEGERRAKGFASRKEHKREACGYCKTERKQGGGACLNHGQKEKIIPFKQKGRKKIHHAFQSRPGFYRTQRKEENPKHVIWEDFPELEIN